MKEELQRIKIAEACGWTETWTTKQGKLCGLEPNKVYAPELPDYLGSLDAMHEAEKVLFASKPGYYERQWWAELTKVVHGIDPHQRGWGDIDTRQHAKTGHASAPQRAEALLRTLDLWESD